MEFQGTNRERRSGAADAELDVEVRRDALSDFAKKKKKMMMMMMEGKSLRDEGICLTWSNSSPMALARTTSNSIPRSSTRIDEPGWTQVSGATAREIKCAFLKKNNCSMEMDLILTIARFAVGAQLGIYGCRFFRGELDHTTIVTT